MVDNIVLKKPEFTVIPYVYGTEDGANFGLPDATRDFYLIHYIFSGHGTYFSPRGKYDVSAGQMFIIKPGEMTRYQADPKNPWSYSWIGFRFAGGMTHNDFPVLNFLSEDVIASEESHRIFERVKAIKTPSYYDYLVLNAIIYDLLWTISSQHNADKFEIELKDYIDIAIQFIQANYSYKLSVEQISNFLGINRRYFCSIFTQKIGISPQEYIIKFRMDKARELLSAGHSVTYAAQNCGYQDVYTFSKIFKKKLGITPSEIRTHYKQNQAKL